MAKEETNKTGDYDPDKSWRDPKQYDMLKRCSEKKDMTEWNEWRKNHPDADIQLRKANFEGFFLNGANFIKAIVQHTESEKVNYAGQVHLEGANFKFANLEGVLFANAILRRAVLWHAKVNNADFHGTDMRDTDFSIAHLQGAFFCEADLQQANLGGSNLAGADFSGANLQGASFRKAIVDGETLIWDCKVNKWSRKKPYTNFAGVGLGDCRIEPGVKQLLEYNIRRSNWHQWYKDHKVLQWVVKPFWLTNDYGFSLMRIILSFIIFSLVFALIYWLCPACVKGLRDGKGILGRILNFIHAFYFSVVTMTTLGFGDIHANSDSWVGQILLMVQVLFGYGLLGSLITRLAILFTADGPAGKFVAMDEGTEGRLKGKK